MNAVLPEWRKSSYSESDNCVELARWSGGNSVRDSKNPARKLEVSRRSVRRLLAFVRA
ncbi:MULTISPECIES: DUF397 domain-containing protein [Actinokineospora]|uniref:Uncharacterized protein DUF397 n=2 Tax=Actinokineospora TaxID=39845 RepID=A0A421AXG7_9PSEU|nr:MULTISPECIES: DUF397 domain-containing protein [Actinokineospora]RLK54488.1 uncharacterized protein DUF397 [Actinokineospora cianjurensis]SES11515.1 protein of unknown function [Actinokineospora terrae]